MQPWARPAINTTTPPGWREIVASAASHLVVKDDQLREHRVDGGTTSRHFPPTTAFLAEIVARAARIAQDSGLVITTWRADAVHGALVRSTLEEQLCSEEEEQARPCPVVNVCDLHRLNLARNATNLRLRGEPYQLVYRGKVIDLLRFLIGLEAARPQGTDVLFADGNDVAWAGCHPHLPPATGLRVALDTLRRASNASIIFNGELSASECVESCPVPSADAVRGSWASALCPQRLPVVCERKRSGGGLSEDSTCYPLYLNSGVFAGAASHLLPMVHWVTSHFRWHPLVRSDQGVCPRPTATRAHSACTVHSPKMERPLIGLHALSHSVCGVCVLMCACVLVRCRSVPRLVPGAPAGRGARLLLGPRQHDVRRARPRLHARRRPQGGSRWRQ